MPSDLNPVFSRDDFARLKSAQRKLHDLLPLLDKAERCGVECDQFRALSSAIGDQLIAIEREFFADQQPQPE